LTDEEVAELEALVTRLQKDRGRKG
jgi:hypothetical protein